MVKRFDRRHFNRGVDDVYTLRHLRESDKIGITALLSVAVIVVTLIAAIVLNS